MVENIMSLHLRSSPTNERSLYYLKAVASLALLFGAQKMIE
jgi:hypothetical protein